jgi:serine/threonine protein kinase
MKKPKPDKTAEAELLGGNASVKKCFVIPDSKQHIVFPSIKPETISWNGLQKSVQNAITGNFLSLINEANFCHILRRTITPVTTTANKSPTSGVNNPKPKLKLILQFAPGIDAFEFTKSQLQLLFTDRLTAKKFCANATLILVLAAKRLLEIHGLNIIHLDIKPENIIVEYNNNGQVTSVDIIDFGQSASIEKEISTPSGTQGFIAPEILELTPSANNAPKKSLRVTEGLDVYSFGITIFCTLFETFDPEHQGSFNKSQLLGQIRSDKTLDNFLPRITKIAQDMTCAIEHRITMPKAFNRLLKLWNDFFANQHPTPQILLSSTSSSPSSSSSSSNTTTPLPQTKPHQHKHHHHHTTTTQHSITPSSLGSATTENPMFFSSPSPSQHAYPPLLKYKPQHNLRSDSYPPKVEKYSEEIKTDEKKEAVKEDEKSLKL